MNFFNRQRVRLEAELEHHRRLSLALAGALQSAQQTTVADLDGLRAEVAAVKAAVAGLPEQIAWAHRFLTDAEERSPELLQALSVEVAAFKFDHPDSYQQMLTTITENANA